MEIMNQPYHFYLIIYGEDHLTEKNIVTKIDYEIESEKVFNEIEQYIGYLKNDRNDNRNRFIILNNYTGIYLGNESITELKESKFFEATVIALINPNTFYFKFPESSKLAFDYLLSQWLILNNLQQQSKTADG